VLIFIIFIPTYFLIMKVIKHIHIKNKKSDNTAIGFFVFDILILLVKDYLFGTVITIF